jgi:hypothetical protein
VEPACPEQLYPRITRGFADILACPNRSGQAAACPEYTLMSCVVVRFFTAGFEELYVPLRIFTASFKELFSKKCVILTADL